MAIYTRHMNQVATYWTPGSNDGFGGVVLGPPVVIKCRWQNKRDLVRNAQGQEVVSSTIVYPDRALQHKGYLALGDFTDQVDSDGLLDPKEVGGSQIIQVGDSPSLDGTTTLYKVWM